MAIHVYKNIDDLSHGLAKWIDELIRKTLENKDKFTVALAGGNTPLKLFDVLSLPQFANSIDWKKVHVFWGDERLVPFDYKDNNAALAYKTLLLKVPIPAKNIHRIDTNIPPNVSLANYQELLESFFPKGAKSFDLVLLGLGTDGHTLSLFDIKQRFDEEIYVVHVTAKEPSRISLTPAIVNRAAKIAFMVSGKEKAKVINDLVVDNSELKYPAQFIRPYHGEIEWFLDLDAAGELDDIH